jgi:hypothetical protein
MTGLRWGAVAYGNGNFVAFDGSGSGYIARVWLFSSDVTQPWE